MINITRALNKMIANPLGRSRVSGWATSGHTYGDASAMAGLFSKRIIGLWLLALTSSAFALQKMPDSELADVTGQALMQMSKENTNGFTFYTAGLDAVLELNMNIQKLQLGCGGANPVNNGQRCDLDADNFALGCIADSSGNCTFGSGGTQMRDLVMTRPYFQFAIKNDNSKTLREVVGIRLGGEKVEGPMSIGNFNSFSGYLSASADFIMEAQGTNSSDDIAITCGTNSAPCPGDRPGNGYNTFGLQTPFRSMGLENGCVSFLGNGIEFKDLTIGFPQVERLDRAVILNGNRQTQAGVYNAQLGSAVDELVDNLTVIRSNGGGLTDLEGLVNALLPVLASNVKDKIKSQLATGLGTTPGNLDNFVIPYNISNLHSVMVDTPLFGVSFQKEAVQYPGYVESVPMGWAMYLPDAFKLEVSNPTTYFVNNIVNGEAALGNITTLPDPGSGAVFDNCWGSATFC